MALAEEMPRAFLRIQIIVERLRANFLKSVNFLPVQQIAPLSCSKYRLKCRISAFLSITFMRSSSCENVLRAARATEDELCVSSL